MRILVAYATRTGSTAGVAAEIGRALGSANGNVADVRPIGELRVLDGYDAVVVGSAVRGSKWLPEAVDFVSEHQEALRRVPVATFAVCLTMREDTAENRAEVARALDPVREVVTPVDVGLFAGAMDYSQFSLPMRLMMKAIKAPEGDFRDWAAIRDWAAELDHVLLKTSSPAEAAEIQPVKDGCVRA
jgi:menaquinone-dependent protoporphyrinogen oxidase